MNVKPTRMGLILTKRKLRLARKGYKLLKQKQDVLVMEFFSTLREVKGLRGSLAGELGRAQGSLQYARAMEGEPSLERITIGLGTTGGLSASSKSVMGIEIPVIEGVQSSEEWPGFYGHTVALDSAIVWYRRLLPDFMKLVGRQLVLKRLAEEIKKTKVRVNSLEYLTIPRLEKQRKMITFKLDELERENFTRLKKIKKRAAA